MRKILLLTSLLAWNAFAINCIEGEMIARIFPFNAEYQLDSAIYLNGSVDAPPEDGEDTWYRTNRYTWNKESSSFRIDTYLTSDSRFLSSYSGTVTSGENTMYVNTYDEEGFYYKTEIFTFIGDSVYKSIETYYDDEEIKKAFLSSSIMIVYTLGK